jgi:hypothetical protein
VAQQQRDGDQPWVLADGHAGDGTNESIEFVSDVEFVEEGVDEPTRPREIVCVLRHLLKDSEAVTLSPVSSLDALGRPGAWLWFRDSLAGGSVAHGRHLRQSAWLWERRRPPCATVCREGRVMDVAWRQRPLLRGWVPGLGPNGG